MRTFVAGLGTARPAHQFAQQDAADLAATLTGATGRERRRLEALYRQTRIQHRSSVLLDESASSISPAADERTSAADPAPVLCSAHTLQRFYPKANGQRHSGPRVGQRLRVFQQHALPLAARAAQRAMAQASVSPDRIGQIVVASCTGMGSPGLEVQLIHALGLDRDVGRTMIGFMGCHGAINALRVARGLALAEPDRDVLVVAVELCSLHFHYEPSGDKALANALFADGAGAAIVRASADEPAGPAALRATGSCVLGDTHEHMSWQVGDHGFEMTLSPRVPALIEAAIGPWLSAWLSDHGLSVAEVAGWAIHPGGPRVIEAVVEGLGLDESQVQASRQVLGDCGNMSSPTVLFIYERLQATVQAGPMVLLAFGPGLVVEAALLERVPKRVEDFAEGWG